MKYFLAFTLSFTISNCLNCPKNYFSLPSMDFCSPFLDCSSMQNITITDNMIGEGAIKKVFKAFWLNHTVALNVLKEPDYLKDFLTGLNFLKLSNSNPLVVKLVGYCEETKVFVSEYHKFGDARNFHRIVKNVSGDNLNIGLKFCLKYVEILEFIHSSDNGVRVMCDSNNLEKTLSQYLISENSQLVLNDVDALPSVIEEKNIRCGHRQIVSEFVAPEQLWPFFNLSYNEADMPKYDEKTDIWKVPDVCEYFLQNTRNDKIVKYELFEVHKLCKNLNPNGRPSATSIKQVYQELLNKLSFHTEL